GVVQPLQRRLASRAEGAAIDRVLGIPLELDGATVAHLGDDTASGGALAAGGAVVGGDARDRLVGRDQVRDELLDLLLATPDGGGHAAGGAKELEEIAALDARGPR